MSDAELRILRAENTRHVLGRMAGYYADNGTGRSWDHDDRSDDDHRSDHDDDGAAGYDDDDVPAGHAAPGPFDHDHGR